MTIVEAVILGVIQGVTEFLPVSSTAHLSLAEYFLGLAETPRFFDVMLHLGTLAAISVYYRQSLVGLLSNRPSPSDETAKPQLPRITPRLFLLICLATVPAVAVTDLHLQSIRRCHPPANHRQSRGVARGGAEGRPNRVREPPVPGVVRRGAGA